MTSVVVAVVLSELGVRCLDRSEASARRPLAERLAATQPAPGATVDLGDIIRPSDRPDVIYELQPSLDVVFRGVRVITDSKGCRVACPDPAAAATSGRLVGIGDSVMFGWGVPFEDSFLARTAAALGPAWEVVNLAVPGYNTVMEAARLEAELPQLRPQVVVMQVIANDLALPPFLLPPPIPRGLLATSALWRRWQLVVRPSATARDGMVEPWTATLQPARVDPELDRRYQLMTGTGGFEAGIARIAAATHGLKTTVIVLLADDRGEPWGELAAIVRRHGLRPIPTVRWFGDELARRGLARSHEAWQHTFWLSPTDPHPNAAGHRVLADGLLRTLAASGVGGVPAPTGHDAAARPSS